MKSRKKLSYRGQFTAACLLLFFLGIGAPHPGQQQDQNKVIPRDIPPAGYPSAKPEGKEKPGAPRVAPPAPAKIRRVPSSEITRIRRGPKRGKLPPPRDYETVDPDFPEGPLPKGMRYAQLGLTIWRARPARSVDQVKGVFDEAESGSTLERTDDTRLVAIGDRLWLSVEPFAPGYLYVINREVYEDDTMGAARLIFPTTLTGHNWVRPRRLAVLPRRDGDKAFRIRASESAKKHVGEAFTIILASQSLNSELPQPISDRAMPLSDEFVAVWEKLWGGHMKRSALPGAAEQILTRKEQTASRPFRKTVEDEAESLNQFDALPQIFFKGALRPNMPSLVTIVLKFKGDTPSSSAKP